MFYSNPNHDLRLLLPETVWLEAEHFAVANQTSCFETNPTQNSWQVYLNTLALLALEIWLDDRLDPSQDDNNSQRQVVYRDMSAIAIAGNIKLGDYKLCAIATENLLAEVVHIPRLLVEQVDLTPHFYVLLEVLEEEEEVVIRGFLPHKRLLEVQKNWQLPIDDNCYQIPLAEFDGEPNHLLNYYRYCQPADFSVPINNAVSDIAVNRVEQISENIAEIFSVNTTKLSRWFQGVIDDTWQTIDSLTTPELGLAFCTRNLEQNTKKGKIIDLGIDLDQERFALLLNICPHLPDPVLEGKPEETEDKIVEQPQKISVFAQLYPLNGKRFLPEIIKLILLSKAGKILQEVTARVQDNYIQLKPFKGEPGKKFSIQVSLGNASVTENFEL